MNNNKIKEQEISDNVDKIQHAAERIQSLSKAFYAVSYTLLVLESQKKLGLVQGAELPLPVTADITFTTLVDMQEMIDEYADEAFTVAHNFSKLLL